MSRYPYTFNYNLLISYLYTGERSLTFIRIPPRLKEKCKENPKIIFRL